MQSYLDKTFVIDDPDARVRQDDDLLSFVMEGGNPKRIPQGTEIRVTDANGILLPLKSGFRTFQKQEFLFDGWTRRAPGFNLAAAPGFSNHEDGFAYDFEINAFEGNPRYDWLKAHAPAHGFVRTVNK